MRVTLLCLYVYDHWLGEVPGGLEGIVEEAMNVLQLFGCSPDVLEEIKNHIEYYIDNKRMVSS